MDQMVETELTFRSLTGPWSQLTTGWLFSRNSLLEFCLTTTYFVYDGVCYRQCFGAPMGAPISPGVADLTMEDFEEEALNNCPPDLTPRLLFGDVMLMTSTQMLLNSQLMTFTLI